MRIANHRGRATVVTDDGHVDLHTASGGRFGPGLGALYEEWDAFREWSAGAGALDTEPFAVEEEDLGAPSPEPVQVFAIGINYRDHAEETSTPVPQGQPPTFTKFQSSIAGPSTELVLSGDSVDHEVELVVVIGRRADHVDAADAWDHVAGLTVGQDFSDRQVQMAGPMPQFSLGKSFPGFSPMGPALVTVEEFDDPDDLALGCTVNGVQVQQARTSQMVFSVPSLIEHLSAVAPLLPGDVIFTGTPAGVGMAQDPQRFLAAGDVVVTEIETIGSIRSVCLAPATRSQA